LTGSSEGLPCRFGHGQRSRHGQPGRFERFNCSNLAKARFFEQSRPHPVVKGEPFTVRIVDISRGGVCAESDWSFAKGELLHLRIPGAAGKSLSRYARVARVRSGQRGKWLMGLSFVEPPKA